MIFRINTLQLMEVSNEHKSIIIQKLYNTRITCTHLYVCRFTYHNKLTNINIPLLVYIK